MNTRKRTILIPFEVLEDDLPSERSADYRQTIVAALSHYHAHTVGDADEMRLADKLLHDCYRDREGDA